MKHLIRLMGLLILVVSSAALAASPPSNGLASSQGVDLFRGAWEGTLRTSLGVDSGQLNLYFGEAVPDPLCLGCFKASGYFSHDELGGPKRADVPKLPMMARYTVRGDGTFDLFVLATYLRPPQVPAPRTTIMKLTGLAQMDRSGVADDRIEGIWYRKRGDGQIVQGTWSAVHLDRRMVKAPEVPLNDPTLGLHFFGDLKIHLFGPAGTPTEQRNPIYAFDCNSNIVMDSVRVTYPNGTSVALAPYTDVFSPGVDWTTQFRFIRNFPGLPQQAESYTFTALDVTGNPIPGVQDVDVWVGVQPPDPPTNVQVSMVYNGMQVTWNAVDPVPESFVPNPDSRLTIGFYQLEISKVGGEMVFGAHHIGIPLHVVPYDRAAFDPARDNGLPLSEMEDGEYVLNVNVHSVAPQGSAGHGFEYSSRDAGGFVYFTISNGVVIP